MGPSIVIVGRVLTVEASFAVGTGRDSGVCFAASDRRLEPWKGLPPMNPMGRASGTLAVADGPCDATRGRRDLAAPRTARAA